MKLLGAVLAGGRSSRFGSDKAIALYRGLSFIQHSLEVITSLTDSVVICGRDVPGRRSVLDRPRSDMGPLGGLNAALAIAWAEGFDGILSLPCDTPTMTQAQLRPLLAQPSDAFYFQDLPVCGFWPARLSPELDALLNSDGPRSMRAWARLCQAHAVEGPDVLNVNTPADWDALLS